MMFNLAKNAGLIAAILTPNILFAANFLQIETMGTFTKTRPSKEDLFHAENLYGYKVSLSYGMFYDFLNTPFFLYTSPFISFGSSHTEVKINTNGRSRFYQNISLGTLSGGIRFGGAHRFQNFVSSVGLILDQRLKAWGHRSNTQHSPQTQNYRLAGKSDDNTVATPSVGLHLSLGYTLPSSLLLRLHAEIVDSRRQDWSLHKANANAASYNIGLGLGLPL